MRLPFGSSGDAIGQPMWALDPKPPVRVLLIDDDDDEAPLTRTLLGRVADVHYELDWVATYGEGLASIRRGEHDAYLVDERLGGRTGTELVREARDSGSLAALIMMTGERDRSTDLAAMNAGATDYLLKGPTDAALLDRTLRYAIAQSTALTALARSRSQIAGLEELSGLLVDSGPRPEVMARIVDLIVERFSLARVAIYLAAGDQLILAGQRGHLNARETMSRRDTTVERVAQARQPVFVPSFSHDGGRPGAGRGVATELSVPLIVDGELAGLLNVASLLVAPIGEADVAVIRLVGERLTAALSLVHEREAAQVALRKARRGSFESQSIVEGDASVYRHLLLEPLLAAAIAAAGAKSTRRPGMLLVARDDTLPGSMDKLEWHARVVFADRPLVRGANGELAVLLLGEGVAVARSEVRRFVDVATAAGLEVRCGLAAAAARSTAAELIKATELALARAHGLAAGAIIG